MKKGVKQLSMHCSFIVCTFFICILLGGCTSGRQQTNNINNKLYLESENDSKANKISQETAELILASADKNDSESIYKLFSEYSKNNNSDLKNEIDSFCKYVNFSASDLKGGMTSDYSNNHGDKVLHYLYSYQFRGSDNNDYILYLGWVANDTDDTTQIGIQFIEIVKKENCNVNLCCDFDDLPGVHILD